MNELKGIFTESEVESMAKFLDSLIDFNELLGDKKVLIIVKLGKLVEKNDRQLFREALSYVDDSIVNAKISDNLKEILVSVKGHIIARDIEGLSRYLSEKIAENVSFLSTDEAEEKVIYGALTMLSGLLSTVLDAAAEKYGEGVAEAEAEDNDNQKNG